MRRPVFMFRVSAAMQFLSAVLAAAVLLACLVSVASAASPIGARSVVLMDAGNGKILYSSNADVPVPPASLTKVAAMYTALNLVKAKKFSLQETVRVSEYAAGQGGSRMHLRPGEGVKLHRLLMGMAVSSGNDASMAVAEHVGGSQARFVRLMNAEMRRLGLRGTTFKNPHGLPAKGQLTTARDMALLAYRYLKRHPEALRYHKTQSIRHNGRLTTNKNPLLGSCKGADGLKTGWITASGYNIIATVKRGGTRLIAVVLGAPTASARAVAVSRIAEAGFEARRRGVAVASVLKGAPAARAEAAPAAHPAPRPETRRTSAVAQAPSPRKSTAAVSATSKRSVPSSGSGAVPDREEWTSVGSLAPLSAEERKRLKGASRG